VTDKKFRLNSKQKGFRVTSPPALWNVNGRENTLDECERTKQRVATPVLRHDDRRVDFSARYAEIGLQVLPQWM
jgi:hypothetical protein